MEFLRIVFVIRSLPFHGLGGMEAIAWDLARAFASRGHEVTVLTTPCPVLRDSQDVEGVRICCLEGPAGKYSQQWRRASERFYTEKLEGHTDVVLSVSAGAMSLAARRSKTDPAIYVVQAHGTAWGEIVSKLSTVSITGWIKALLFSRHLIDDLGYRHFDAMISAGPRITNDLTRLPTRFIIGNLPVHEISNGIDTDAFAFDQTERLRIRNQYGIPEKAPVVLALSRLHAQKGIQHALEGFARARAQHPELRFLVVGSGPHESALREQADRLNLGSSVVFTGAISRDRVGALYSAADIFIFTSTRIEGLPLNVLEALASGLPVIVSRHIAVPGQRHQHPVDPQNPEEVSKAIAEAVARRDETPRACRLEETYWLTRSVDRYLQLFKTLRQATRDEG